MFFPLDNPIFFHSNGATANFPESECTPSKTTVVISDCPPTEIMQVKPIPKYEPPSCSYWPGCPMFDSCGDEETSPSDTTDVIPNKDEKIK